MTKKLIAFVLFVVHSVALCFGGPKECIAVHEAIVWAAQNANPSIPADNFQSPPPPAVESNSAITKSDSGGTSHKVKPEWQVMACNLEGCMLWDARDIGNGCVLCSADIDEDRATNATITIVHGDVRKSGKFFSRNASGTVFQVADAADAINKALSQLKGKTADPFAESPKPMAMSFPKAAALSEVLPAQLVITCWEKGCPAGVRQEKEIIRQLRPLNWKIGDTDDCQILFVHGPPEQPCPTIELYQNGSVIQKWEGFQEPAALSNALRKAWDAAGDHPHSATQATGLGGDIHASNQVRQALDYCRKFVGSGNRSSMDWSRNGSPALSLFAMGEWDAISIFGSDGRIQLDSPDAIGLPIKTLAFGYRIVGRDMIIDAEPVRFPGLADKLSLGGKHSQAVGATPYGIIGIDDALEVYWVVCMFKDIFALLRPSADLTLPNDVSGSAVLNDDALTIEFTKPPVIKLVWLFTFKLAVKKVVLTEKNVHVEFSGSRWIKSRDFVVK